MEDMAGKVKRETREILEKEGNLERMESPDHRDLMDLQGNQEGLGRLEGQVALDKRESLEFKVNLELSFPEQEHSMVEASRVIGVSLGHKAPRGNLALEGRLACQVLQEDHQEQPEDHLGFQDYQVLRDLLVARVEMVLHLLDRKGRVAYLGVLVLLVCLDLLENPLMFLGMMALELKDRPDHLVHVANKDIPEKEVLKEARESIAYTVLSMVGDLLGDQVHPDHLDHKDFLEHLEFLG